MPTNEKSDCCHAEMMTVPDLRNGKNITRYECQKCFKECEPTPDKLTKNPQDILMNMAIDKVKKTAHPPLLPTPSKLAEAKKLLEIWNIEKSDTMGGYVYINPIHVAHTDALLAAQSLISYERGREEQRKETIKRVKSVKRGNWENTPEKYKWPMDAPYYSCYIRGFNAAKFRINQTINPSPDAK